MADRPKLGELLLVAGVIDEAQLAGGLAEQEKWGGFLGVTLVQLGFIDEETLVRTLARQLRLPVAWLRGKRIKPEVLELVPKELVLKYRCLPLQVDKRKGKTLLLAMENPADIEAADEVSFHAGIKVRAVLAAPSELSEAIKDHFPSNAPANGEFDVALSSDPGPELLSLSGSPDDHFSFGDPSQDLGGGLGERPETTLVPLYERVAKAEATESTASPQPQGVNIVLRAVTQLLVEKGILSPEELVKRLGELGGSAADLGSAGES